jgi:hypothetical protein
MKRTWLWILCLFLWFIPQGHTQEALAIYAQDVFIEAAPDQQGFHLFIRKKPGVSSVLLMDSGGEDAYAYQTLEWNEVNGGWFLRDSSPEDHPRLGEAFHIYIPSVITYGSRNTRHATLTVGEGFFINIRGFSQPGYSGEFRDNPFTLTQRVPDDSMPSMPPQIQFLPPDLETVNPPASGPPSLPVEDSSPDLSASPKAGQETPPPEPPPPAPPDLGPPDINPLPKAEDFVFAPIIHIRGGLAIFFPGPEGRNVQLKNNYDPVGSITLTNWFTKTWGIHLGFDRDPLLMNRLLARAVWDSDFIGLEAGPYFGLLNSETGQVSPGLSLILHARLPWWNFFSSFRWDGAPGRAPAGPGDYIQAFSEIKAGMVLPFGRLILSLTGRNTTVRDDLSVDVVSHWARYNLAMEIALPSGPWGLQIDLGYQRLHWTYYLDLQEPLNYGYYNIYTGLELSCRIKSLTLLFGLEAPLYPFVYSRIKSLADPQSPFFGQISLGIRWALPPR